MKEEDFDWTEQLVIGRALMLIGGTIDSFGDPITPDIFYKVGKRKEDGMTAILPTEKNARHEFLNSILKMQNKFN